MPRSALTAGARHSPPVARLLFGYLLPAGVYWVVRQSALTERRVHAALGALAAFGIYLAATGLLEVTQQWWLVFPPYIADPVRGLGFGCARGPMLQPVSFGSYVAVGMLSAWLLRGRRRGRWLLVTSFPLFLAALFVTYTRSVWLGALSGLFIVFALTLRRYWRGLVLGSMLAAIVFVGATKWETLLAFPRGTETAEGTRHSAYLRLSFAYVSWRMFVDRPWFGVHFGHFPAAKLPYLADRSTSLDLESLRPLAHHNVFLSLLTETGLIGLAAFVTLLGCWTRMGWRIWRDTRAPDWARLPGALLLGALGVYVGQWMFHELSFGFIDHGLLFVVAGMAAAARHPIAALTAAR